MQLTGTRPRSKWAGSAGTRRTWPSSNNYQFFACIAGIISCDNSWNRTNICTHPKDIWTYLQSTDCVVRFLAAHFAQSHIACTFQCSVATGSQVPQLCLKNVQHRGAGCSSWWSSLSQDLWLWPPTKSLGGSLEEIGFLGWWASVVGRQWIHFALAKQRKKSRWRTLAL